MMRPLAALLLAGSLAACAAGRRPVEDAGEALSPGASLAGHAGFVRLISYAPGDPRHGPRRLVVGGGSGTLIDHAGIVVTAAHVVAGPGYLLEVEAPDGRRARGFLLSFDAASDLAVACVPALREAPGARLRIAAPRKGEPVLAFGSPGKRKLAMAAGRVFAVRGDGRLRYGRYRLDHPLELAMHVMPGYSGGPVLDTRGQVIGMITSFAMEFRARGEPRNLDHVFAVPASRLSTAVAAQAGRCRALSGSEGPETRAPSGSSLALEDHAGAGRLPGASNGRERFEPPLHAMSTGPRLR